MPSRNVGANESINIVAKLWIKYSNDVDSLNNIISYIVKPYYLINYSSVNVPVQLCYEKYPYNRHNPFTTMKGLSPKDVYRKWPVMKFINEDDW